MTFAARAARRFVLALALAGPVVVLAASDASAQKVQKRRGWMGVELEPAKGAVAGARVSHVVRTSPAEQAGVHDGDVIVRIEEVTVAGPDQVIAAVRARSPGDAVRATLVRGGRETVVTLTLKEMPDGDEMLRIDKVGASAPALRGLAPVTGQVPADLHDMHGRVVVLDFWASWCTACRMATPRLSEWQAKFGGQGLSVLGITDDPVPAASQGVTSFGMRYPVASDESAATAHAYGVKSLPTLFVIDKRGVIREVVVGFDPSREAQTEALLVRLLAEPSPGPGASAH